MLAKLKYLFIIGTLSLSFSGCKQGSDAFDLLGSSDTTSVEDLEITSRIPDQALITLKIGESQQFAVTALAPAPRTVSYSWKLDGSASGAGQVFTFTATAGLVGEHSLKAIVTDGESVKENEWTIVVNAPPVITAISTGTQKVAVGSTINISASATDPNGDTLTYSWVVDGATSAFLTGTTGTGSFTGDSSLVGARTITLTVSDGIESVSTSWSAEVNYFPQACNTLAQGEICTYSGGPHKGTGYPVTNTTFPLRFRPFSHVQDALGNIFISDLDSNVIWYWNKTAAPVSRIGQTIPAGVIQIVAGTGEAASGGSGIPALQSALNSPRGLWYNDVTGTLYVAEYSGHAVKYIDNTGTVFVGMGGGTSHVDGNTAYNHDCNNPVHLAHYNNNLYVTCYAHHRVKRWDLATDLGYIAGGDGGNDIAGENTNPTTSGIGNPYGLYVDANGIYVGSYSQHVVRFINHSGAPYTFWSGNPDQVIVANGMIASIIGDGGTSEPGLAMNPLSESLGRPVTITVRNGNEIFVGGQQRDDIVLVNNSGAGVTIDGITVNPGLLSRINNSAGGYNGDINISNARVDDPYQLSVDILDNNKLILSDYNNYRLRELDFTSGRFSNLAGTGRGELGFYGDVELPTQEHLFNYPTGILFDDTTRTLFFADQNNHRLRQTDAYGRTSTALCRGAGDPTIDNDFPSNALCRTNINSNNSMNNSFDIWSDGSLAVLNSYGHNVRIWNRSGADQTYLGSFIQNDRVTTVAGDWVAGAGNGPDGPALNTQYQYPNSVKFFNNAGNMELWILDTMNHCLRMVDSAGNSTTMLGLCGTSGDPGPSAAAAAARFNRPRGLLIDGSGNIYISDYNNDTIWFWNRGGSPVTIGTVTINPNDVAKVACLSGSSGSSAENVFATTARCNEPAGLAMSGNNLCFAQRNRHNVRCIDITTGLISTVAGRVEAAPRSGSLFDYSQEGVAATSATLSYPAAIAFDANGDLYISDTYNHVIRKVKLSP
ncbi:MAG: hypothetical protein KDD33_01345 [Bdellovibrionales bacterium]|nr:hypothetical protein [Bdellovibrionales bacterium]